MLEELPPLTTKWRYRLRPLRDAIRRALEV